MTVFTAPDKFDANIVKQKPSIFLAGSIEQGTATDWHSLAIQFFNEHGDFNVLSPRRANWDPTLNDNPIKLKKQVDWELDGLETVDVVLMYFDPTTKSPISLLELGLILGQKKPVVVCCPIGFWRRGNVVITCQRHNVQVLSNMDSALLECAALTKFHHTVYK